MFETSATGDLESIIFERTWAFLCCGCMGILAVEVKCLKKHFARALWALCAREYTS
jgi:hypothetical protein